MLHSDAPIVVIDLEQAYGADVTECARVLAPLPIIVVGVGQPAKSAPRIAQLLDVIVDPNTPQLERIRDTVASNPIAAVALTLLLRAATDRSVGEGLVAESAMYSALQGGHEFAAWRARHAVREPDDRDPPSVHIEREDDAIHITLARPHVRNAMNTRMRDELYEAFLVAAADPTVHVILTGNGPSFCAGGDLHEFGSRPDPSTAHVTRLQRSVGRLIASIADRVEARVHGACMGSGIEIPAFASKIAARSDAYFGLPEVSLGLIPGAGGTVSITRRIGRHRTAWLALSGSTIDVRVAHDWGLIDEIGDE